MHAAPFTLALSVWVPTGTDRKWVPCGLSASLGDETIKSCSELRAVLGAHSRLMARLLSAPPAPKYDGFRIIGRRADTDVLVTEVEWKRSTETGQLVQDGDVFTACEWVHCA